MLSLGTLITYAIVSRFSVNHEVDTSTVFTVIAVLGVITTPLTILGHLYASIVAATASIKRIEDFLQKPEVDDQRCQSDGISARDSTFVAGDTILLKNLNFEIPLRKLTMIVGNVGSVSGISFL